MVQDCFHPLLQRLEGVFGIADSMPTCGDAEQHTVHGNNLAPVEKILKNDWMCIVGDEKLMYIHNY